MPRTKNVFRKYSYNNYDYYYTGFFRQATKACHSLIFFNTINYDPQEAKSLPSSWTALRMKAWLLRAAVSEHSIFSHIETVHSPLLIYNGYILNPAMYT